MYYPDKLLLNSLVYDLTDVVCKYDSPLKDIRERCVLQQLIYEIVFELRNGLYYTDRMKLFLMSFTSCNAIIQHTPETCYVGDEGNFMKKILGIFSIKPIVIYTKSPHLDYMSMANNIKPYHSVSVLERVNYLDMLTLNINEDNQNLNTFENLKKFDQLIYENGNLTIKSCEIAYVHEVLIVYVPRRISKIDYGAFINSYSLMDPTNKMLFISPKIITGLESINRTPINVVNTITI